MQQTGHCLLERLFVSYSCWGERLQGQRTASCWQWWLDTQKCEFLCEDAEVSRWEHTCELPWCIFRGEELHFNLNVYLGRIGDDSLLRKRSKTLERFYCVTVFTVLLLPRAVNYSHKFHIYKAFDSFHVVHQIISSHNNADVDENLSLSHLTIAGLFFRTSFISHASSSKEFLMHLTWHLRQKNVELYYDVIMIFNCITMSQKVRVFDHECPHEYSE